MDLSFLNSSQSIKPYNETITNLFIKFTINQFFIYAVHAEVFFQNFPQYFVNNFSLPTSLKWTHSCVQCECETAFFESIPSVHVQTFITPCKSLVFLRIPVEGC